MSAHNTDLRRGSHSGAITNAIMARFSTLTWVVLACVVRVQGVTTGGNMQCALLLPRPPTSCLFVHTFNPLLLLQPPPSVSWSCITYSDVDRAFLDASTRRGDWQPEDVASLGEVLLDTTRILAHRYGLSYLEVWSALPKMNVSRTLVGRYCPDFAVPTTCVACRYRSHDGRCNNLRLPTLAATRSVFARLVPPAYSDGVGAPRDSVVRGGRLPSPRVVSSVAHRDQAFQDHTATLYLVAWGQFMDHDFTLTATPVGRSARNQPQRCCRSTPGASPSPYCLPIRIPQNDDFYRQFKMTCMEFMRALSGVRQDCRLGVRAPFNMLTSVIDANTVYGSSLSHSRRLRAMHGGLLRMNDSFASIGLRELLPPKLDDPDQGCIRLSPDHYCFLAGETRVNEQLMLTAIHTLWFRQHNRLARLLAVLNPHWDDETLYQETRRIVVAQIQHITFNEFLPLVLGEQVMARYQLQLQKSGYWEGHDPSVDPSMTAAFVAAAYRFGHSLVPSTVERWSSSHRFIDSTRLSKLIQQPWDMYRPGILDQYYVGFMNQPAEAVDNSVTQEVTNHLFEQPGKHYGLDLVSINLQRGREFGLPGYTSFRRLCGLPPVHSFQDLGYYMANITVNVYQDLYSHVDDIDLWSGGVSERPLPGSMLGPTFACIVALQMQRLRQGDRYWYEVPGQPSSFTLPQLESIRTTSLARILCDNTDLLLTLQLSPMALLNHITNPRVSCESGFIPRLDLTPWTDPPQYPYFREVPAW
ncbi:peroxidase-like [Panulirus ornatus]|uniref:peroxidase-like n=1 Tax=Panulirus ornatus TaxID=150431 RepID=UPI003A873FD2